MKSNIRTRNIAVNSYIAILLITIAGAFACFLILHVAYDTSLQSVFAAATEPASL